MLEIWLTIFAHFVLKKNIILVTEVSKCSILQYFIWIKTVYNIGASLFHADRYTFILYFVKGSSCSLELMVWQAYIHWDSYLH